MTSEENLNELEKWEKYFSLITEIQESEYLRNFGIEFVQKVDQLLPEGGSVLEMGCGAGWQSLALSRTGKYKITMLDMSESALSLARKIFERENQAAEYVLSDAFEFEQGKFDLVFNAGVLEHYNSADQSLYLQKMAMRSNKYVLVLAPNYLCEWYWFWRIQSTINMDWPFGKEVPIIDLSQQFKDAGLHYIGQSYMGKGWTESFINHLAGTDENFREIALGIHRSNLLTDAQKSYLVAFLGSVQDIAVLPPGWEASNGFKLPGTEEMLESISISLSQNIQEKRNMNLAMLEKEQVLNELKVQVNQLKGEIERVEKEKIISVDLLQGIITRDRLEYEGKLAQLQANLESATQELNTKTHELSQIHETHLIEIETLKSSQANELFRLHQSHQDEMSSTRDTLSTEISSIKADYDQLWNTKNEKERTLEILSSELKEIHRSNAWKLARLIWTIEVRLRSYRMYAQVEARIRQALRSRRSRRGSAQPISLTTAHVNSPRLDNTLPTESMPGAEQGNDVPAIYLQSHSTTRVILLTPTFFDWDGNNMFRGGAERYLIELSAILKQLGYDPIIVQCGNFDWMRYYYDVQVIGIRVVGAPENLTRAIERLKPVAELFIYSPFYLASEKINVPSIGISHGIYWDEASFQTFPGSLKNTISDILKQLDAVSQIVSVDTNTINWLRSTRSELVAKSTYLANFVDHHQFKPVIRDSQRLVILFPRRLYKPRGFWLLAEILPEILDEYPQVDFYLVGQAAAEEEIQVQEWIKQYPGRVRHEVFEPDQMHTVYQQADITLIPTIHSEGTSLSCLEAMASGNAVIATNVGGLPDLILSEFNGLLVEPKKSSLKAALVRLLKDPDLRLELGKNARKTVESAFTLELWRERWTALLKNLLPSRPSMTSTSPRTLVFPYTGIGWEGIKQRPHHIASQFAQKGFEIFWVDPAGHFSPAPHIHLLNLEDQLYLKDPLLLIYYPYNFEEITKFRQPVVIHDILDDISIFDHVTWDAPGKTARDYYQRLLERADIVITSSQVLLEKIRPQRSDVLFVPNGIDLDHFDAQKYAVPDEIKKISHPIIGFHGAIADWVDIRLIAQVAGARPDYQFVLVGPVSIAEKINELAQLANVHLIDSVRYERIPAYIKGFDIGILPFVLSPLTHAVRPLKILEYLAMGKPVVATPIDEIRAWPGVQFAQDANKFSEQLDSIVQSGCALQDTSGIRGFLEQSTWQAVVEPLMQKLEI